MKINEMKKILRAKGSCYFDRDTIEFWGSQIESRLNKNGLFVESIDDFYREHRLYKVCCFATEGHVYSLNFTPEEPWFRDKDSAHKFMNMLSIILGELRQIKTVKVEPWGYEFEDIAKHKKKYEFDRTKERGCDERK